MTSGGIWPSMNTRKTSMLACREERLGFAAGAIGVEKLGTAESGLRRVAEHVVRHRQDLRRPFPLGPLSGPRHPHQFPKRQRPGIDADYSRKLPDESPRVDRVVFDHRFDVDFRHALGGQVRELHLRFLEFPQRRA